MFSGLEGNALACFGQQTVIDLATMAGNVAPEDRIPHPQEYFVHAKRIIFRDLLGCSERDAGERLYDVTGEQDIMGLLAGIKPPLDPEIIDEFRLDLMDRAIVLARDSSVASLDRTALDKPGAGCDMHDGSSYRRISTAHRNITFILQDRCRVEVQGKPAVEFVNECIENIVDPAHGELFFTLLLPDHKFDCPRLIS